MLSQQGRLWQSADRPMSNQSKNNNYEYNNKNNFSQKQNLYNNQYVKEHSQVPFPFVDDAKLDNKKIPTQRKTELGMTLGKWE